MDDRARDTTTESAHLVTGHGTRRHTLRLFAGGALGGLILTGGIKVAALAARGSEDNWRTCRKCRGLYLKGEGASTCPAGGGHSQVQGTAYLMRFGDARPNEEDGWRFCAKCKALFYSYGGGDLGVCPAGGNHSTTIVRSYVLEYNHSPSTREQSGWRYCSPCKGLFNGRGGRDGVCPAGGGHTVFPNYNYNVGLDL